MKNFIATIYEHTVINESMCVVTICYLGIIFINLYKIFTFVKHQKSTTYVHDKLRVLRYRDMEYREDEQEIETQRLRLFIDSAEVARAKKRTLEMISNRLVGSMLNRNNHHDSLKLQLWNVQDQNLDYLRFNQVFLSADDRQQL